MTVKVPYRTKHHIIDYNEEDDEFTVTVKGKRFIDTVRSQVDIQNF